MQQLPVPQAPFPGLPAPSAGYQGLASPGRGGTAHPHPSPAISQGVRPSAFLLLLPKQKVCSTSSCQRHRCLCSFTSRSSPSTKPRADTTEASQARSLQLYTAQLEVFSVQQRSQAAQQLGRGGSPVPSPAAGPVQVPAVISPAASTSATTAFANLHPGNDRKGFLVMVKLHHLSSPVPCYFTEIYLSKKVPGNKIVIDVLQKFSTVMSSALRSPW